MHAKNITDGDGSRRKSQKLGRGGGGQGVVDMSWGRNFSLCLEKVFIIMCIDCFIKIELSLKILKRYLIPLLLSV